MELSLKKRVGKVIGMLFAIAIIVTGVKLVMTQQVYAQDLYADKTSVVKTGKVYSEPKISDLKLEKKAEGILVTFYGAGAGFKVKIDVTQLQISKLKPEKMKTFSYSSTTGKVSYEEVKVSIMIKGLSPEHRFCTVEANKATYNEGIPEYSYGTAFVTGCYFEPGTIKRFSVYGRLEFYRDYYVRDVWIDCWFTNVGCYDISILRSEKENGKYIEVYSERNVLIKDGGNRCWSAKDHKTHPGKTYYYKIAYSESGVSNSTDIKKVPQCPIDFKIKKITNSDKGKPILTFTYPSGAEVFSAKGSADLVYVKSINVYRSTKKNSGYQKIGTSYKGYYVDKSAVAGKTYYYKASILSYNPIADETYELAMTKPKKLESGIHPYSFNVKATAKSATSISLVWDKQGNATKYLVYGGIGTKGKATKLMKTTKKNSCVIDNLQEGQTYTFYVRVIGSSKKMYANSCKTKGYLGIHAPKIRLKKQTTTYLKNDNYKRTYELCWDKMYGIDGYKVYYCDENKKDYKFIKELPASAKEFSYTLKYKYYFPHYLRLVAYKGGESASVDYELNCQLELPKMKIQKKTDTSVTLTWNKIPGATTYRISRYTENGIFLDDVYEGGKNTVTVKNLQPGVAYYFTIIAENHFCNSGVYPAKGWENYDWSNRNVNTSDDKSERGVISVKLSTKKK